MPGTATKRKEESGRQGGSSAHVGADGLAAGTEEIRRKKLAMERHRGHLSAGSVSAFDMADAGELAATGRDCVSHVTAERRSRNGEQSQCSSAWISTACRWTRRTTGTRMASG